MTARFEVERPWSWKIDLRRSLKMLIKFTKKVRYYVLFARAKWYVLASAWMQRPLTSPVFSAATVISQWAGVDVGFAACERRIKKKKTIIITQWWTSIATAFVCRTSWYYTAIIEDLVIFDDKMPRDHVRKHTLCLYTHTHTHYCTAFGRAW